MALRDLPQHPFRGYNITSHAFRAGAEGSSGLCRPSELEPLRQALGLRCAINTGQYLRALPLSRFEFSACYTIGRPVSLARTKVLRVIAPCRGCYWARRTA